MIELFKVLGDENRLRILNLLIDAELCVCEIEVILEMTQSNVSRHLSKLKKVGVISSTKDAQWVHHKVSDEFIMNNKLLFSYLKQQLTTENVYINDLKRYNKYKENNMHCEWIAKDREKVLKVIKF